MPIFDDTIPANTEALGLGAQRIRELKTSLETLLGNIFSDSAGTFLSDWVVGDMLEDSGVTAQTYLGITFDAKGRATGISVNDYKEATDVETPVLGGTGTSDTPEEDEFLVGDSGGNYYLRKATVGYEKTATEIRFGFRRRIVYDQAGTYTFTAPETVTARIKCIGGGGGGGAGKNGGSGGGGGAGGLGCSFIALTATSTYTVVVGAGGAASSAGGNSTWETTTIVGNGGSAGVDGVFGRGSGSAGGSGGTGVGDTTLTGLDGESDYVDGGNGGASFGGPGVGSDYPGGTAGNGGAGAGGGGGDADSGTAGTGGDGIVIIEW